DGAARAKSPAFRASEGLNENYARELLELHTLGVDGGYSQDDVEAVARAFTGWTMLPPVAADRLGAERLQSPRARRAGFVSDGVFVFHPGYHDASKKRVLGVDLPAGRGIEDGQEVLDILVAHPSTARHLAHKLAVRFVADEPPAEVVDALAETFSRSQGDLRAVVRRLLELPQFWGAPRTKVRSPFELVAAAIRALDGHLERPSREIFDALESMGQPLYAQAAPTGYPDEAGQWLNSGTLLARMNFAVALLEGEVPGIRRPSLESSFPQVPAGDVRGAVRPVVQALLPERSVDETVARLLPLVEDALENGEAPPSTNELFAWTLGSPEFQRR
ncbi:MAG: DUF1800 domain-containing protein, partial [Acidobacteria bacterium]